MALIGMLVPTLLVLLFMGGVQLVVERCFSRMQWRPASRASPSAPEQPPMFVFMARPREDSSAIRDATLPQRVQAPAIGEAHHEPDRALRHQYDPETLSEAVHAKPRVAIQVVDHPRKAAFALKAELTAQGAAVHVHVCVGPNEGQRDLVFVTSNTFPTYIVVFVGTSLFVGVAARHTGDLV